MDNGLAAYRAALTGAANVSGPTPMQGATTPDNLVSTFANLRNLAQNQSRGTASRIALGASSGAYGNVADQQKADAQQQLQAEQANNDAIAQAKKDALDPSKYRKEIASDGGYEFFDPQGNKIDVKQYSAATGQHITDVLKNSQNPADTQFVTDYKNLQKLGGIMQNGDKAALDKLYKAQPDLKKEISGKTYAQIVSDFRNYYPKFFNQQPENQSQTQTVYGNKTPGSVDGSGGNGFVQKLMSLFGG